MTTTERYPDQGDWQNTLAGVVAAYPAAFRVGLGYWSEMAGNASSYYLDLLDSLVSACRQPARTTDVLGDAHRGLREFLQRSGEATERAILDFNERVTATFRSSVERSTAAREAGPPRVTERLSDLADRVSIEALRFQESQTPADLRSLREQLEQLLREIRSAESGTPLGPSEPPNP